MPPFAATRRRLGASPRFVRHKPSCRRFNKTDKKVRKKIEKCLHIRKMSLPLHPQLKQNTDKCRSVLPCEGLF